jgi:peptide/nickel transport system substrate-binding protein
MGTGPYKVDSYDTTRGAELSANDSYWGGRPQIRGISIKPFLGESSMAIAFRAGELDLATGIRDGRAFEATSGKKVERRASCENAQLTLQSGAGPTSDVHVRRAIAYAINYKQLIAARGGFAVPMYSFLTNQHLYLLGSKKEVDAALKRMPQYRYNLAKARAELAKSAYPNGFKTKFWVSKGYPVAPYQALVPMLKAIGIDVTLTTGGDFVPRIYGGVPSKRMNTILENDVCNSPDPAYYSFEWEQTKDGKAGFYNSANYASREVAALSAAADAAPPGNRLPGYEKLFTKLMTDLPYIPLFQAQSIFAISNRFTWPTYNGGWGTHPWAQEIKPK